MPACPENRLIWYFCGVFSTIINDLKIIGETSPLENIQEFNF